MQMKLQRRRRRLMNQNLTTEDDGPGMSFDCCTGGGEGEIKNNEIGELKPNADFLKGRLGLVVVLAMALLILPRLEFFSPFQPNELELK